MAKLVVNQDKVGNIEEIIKICPFGALENKDGKLEINANCKMCKMCVKKGPKGAVEYIEEEVVKIDKSKWNGVAVYVDHVDGDIHPVTFELIGKARELANKVNQKVYCIFIGSNIKEKAEFDRKAAIIEQENLEKRADLISSIHKQAPDIIEESEEESDEEHREENK